MPTILLCDARLHVALKLTIIALILHPKMFSPDIMISISNHLDDRDCFVWCRLNKKFWKISCSEKFWHSRIVKRYGIRCWQEYPIDNWKDYQIYIRPISSGKWKSTDTYIYNQDYNQIPFGFKCTMVNKYRLSYLSGYRMDKYDTVKRLCQTLPEFEILNVSDMDPITGLGVYTCSDQIEKTFPNPESYFYRFPIFSRTKEPFVAFWKHFYQLESSGNMFMKQKFNLPVNPIGYKTRRWIRALNLGYGRDYCMLQQVVEDAEQKVEIVISGGSYYSCAKFIQNYYVDRFSFKKKKNFDLTCCRAYPKICHGHCCETRYDDCLCNHRVPKRCKAVLHKNGIGSVFCSEAECCKMYMVKNLRLFRLIWI